MTTARYVTVTITTRDEAEITTPIYAEGETLSAVYDIDLEEDDIHAVSENVDDHLMMLAGEDI